MNWHDYHMQQARGAAQKSLDPSTKVGARVVDKQNRLISEGYNGPPRKVDNRIALRSREIKLRVTLHAELNAILFAHQDLTGCTLYVWPFEPCSQCAAAIIQVGIEQVITMQPTAEAEARWGGDWELADEMFQQAGVELTYLEEFSDLLS